MNLGGQEQINSPSTSCLSFFIAISKKQTQSFKLKIKDRGTTHMPITSETKGTQIMPQVKNSD
jgi:hypothetical protein